MWPGLCMHGGKTAVCLESLRVFPHATKIPTPSRSLRKPRHAPRRMEASAGRDLSPLAKQRSHRPQHHVPSSSPLYAVIPNVSPRPGYLNINFRLSCCIIGPVFWLRRIAAWNRSFAVSRKLGSILLCSGGAELECNQRGGDVIREYRNRKWQ